MDRTVAGFFTAVLVCASLDNIWCQVTLTLAGPNQPTDIGMPLTLLCSASESGSLNLITLVLLDGEDIMPNEVQIQATSPTTIEFTFVSINATRNRQMAVCRLNDVTSNPHIIMVNVPNCTSDGDCIMPGTECVNTPGVGRHFMCNCANGYIRVNTTFCEDIDECMTDNGGCEQNCTNTEGSRDCGCEEGYVLINETHCGRDMCAINNGGCDHDCTNTNGSRVCSCEQGHMLVNETKCVEVQSTMTIPTTATPSGSSNPSSAPALPVGAIIGIAVGGVVGAALILAVIAILIYCFCCNLNSDDNKDEKPRNTFQMENVKESEALGQK